MTVPVQVTPLGHATCLVEVGELRLLTDPIFDGGTGLLRPFRLASRRLQPVPVPPEALGPIHGILLSHAHLDHTDKPSLRALPTSATVVCHHRNDDLVRRFPDRRALRWGETTTIRHPDGTEVRIVAIAAGHYGARWMWDRWRGYGGFLIEVTSQPAGEGRPGPLTMLFAGDTALTSAYAELRNARGGHGVDLAIMPVGAYDPWIKNHCSPEQAWTMAMRDLGATRFMPMHYEMFPLSREPAGEPLARLMAVADEDGMRDRVVGMQIGVPWRVDGRS
ncbi:MAG: MBL fold metallo-hydrolase [Sandaracinus sp.]|nr:MBL fold metallo-hydrolase [Sandaracinus sp.]MCB9635367.1 MBL fold metallo-hydrolase [Sandaracinus sp.]